MGNSPLACTPQVVKNKRLFLTTTNGTRALQRVANAPQVITAAQVNRQAAVNYILETQPETVWMVRFGMAGRLFGRRYRLCGGDRSISRATE